MESVIITDLLVFGMSVIEAGERMGPRQGGSLLSLGGVRERALCMYGEHMVGVPA